jgi:hypothetical protein
VNEGCTLNLTFLSKIDIVYLESNDQCPTGPLKKLMRQPTDQEILGDHSKDKKVSEESINLDRWLQLRRSWPSDGWDGAAQARSEHALTVRMIEAELADEHEKVGHGPVEWFGVGSERCVCGVSHKDKPMADLRRIDRYGKWMGKS